MDEREDTTLVAALGAIPDPRQARGRRYPWALWLTLISAAVVSGQPQGRAIGQWVAEHAAELQRRLGWTGRRLPRAATLRRALVTIDLDALEQQVEHLTPGRPRPATAGLSARALDDQLVRGALAHGQRVWLLGLADGRGRLVTPTAVVPGQTELTTARTLLAGHDLTAQVVSADAAVSDPDLARQIRGQHGPYLVVVKDNQPDLRWAIATEFTEPNYLVDERAQVYAVIQTEAAGHGRLETRTREASPRLGEYLAADGWPDGGRVLRRTCRRVVCSTGGSPSP